MLFLIQLRLPDPGPNLPSMEVWRANFTQAVNLDLVELGKQQLPRRIAGHDDAGRLRVDNSVRYAAPHDPAASRGSSTCIANLPSRTPWRANFFTWRQLVGVTW